MGTANTRPFHHWRIAALLLLGAWSTGPALAGDTLPHTLPAWDRLSAAQREQLIAPVRQRWDAEPAQRARMLNHAQRWQQMTPDQRKHARRGLRRWEHMDAGQRAQSRAFFQSTRALTAEQRSDIRQRWPQMTPEQRRAWLQAHPPKP